MDLFPTPLNGNGRLSRRIPLGSWWATRTNDFPGSGWNGREEGQALHSSPLLSSLVRNVNFLREGRRWRQKMMHKGTVVTGTQLKDEN